MFFVVYIMLLLETTAATTYRSTEVNDRPIIGVVAQETSSQSQYYSPHYGDAYIFSSYFAYLQMAGARTIPVMINKTDDYYLDLFKKINGLLFPGGSVDLSTSGYGHIGQLAYKWAIQAYDNGVYFPLWGTCQGFELLALLTAGKNLLLPCQGENITLPLNFTKDAFHSRMLGSLPTDLAEKAHHQRVIQNNHHWCLLTSIFNKTSPLNEFYNVLSTNTDSSGIVYVSSWEAKKYPIYGVQFHPEKAIYTWNTGVNVSHSNTAVQFTQYLANFFVQEAKKNFQKFPLLQEEVSSVIQNYPTKFFQDNSFYSIYFFNVSKPTKMPHRSPVISDDRLTYQLVSTNINEPVYYYDYNPTFTLYIVQRLFVILGLSSVIMLMCVVRHLHIIRPRPIPIQVHVSIREPINVVCDSNKRQGYSR